VVNEWVEGEEWVKLKRKQDKQWFWWAVLGRF